MLGPRSKVTFLTSFNDSSPSHRTSSLNLRGVLYGSSRKEQSNNDVVNFKPDPSSRKPQGRVC